MSTPEQVAQAHYLDRARLVRDLAREARRLWLQVDPADIRRSWQFLAAQQLIGLAGAQLVAAQAADHYTSEVLEAQGIDAEPAGPVVPRSLAGVASDGRSLATLLEQPAIGSLMALAAGATTARAMATGYATLDMIVRTQVADAGRVGDQVALAARPQVTGYVRMVVGKTCSRCIILAGRWYRWSTGFKRHPRCDCIHIPAAESAHELRTDPKLTFNSMSRPEQDKAFTQAGAQAIRDGADMSQVVNARRGMQTASVFGRDVLITTEGTTTRGVAGRRLGAAETGTKVGGGRYRTALSPRLMPEQIYREANGDRDEAVRLLRRFGYIL